MMYDNSAAEFNPHGHESFTPDPAMERMLALADSDPAKFDTLFSGQKRISLGHYVDAKKRAEANR